MDIPRASERDFTVGEAVMVGVLVLLVGTIPRNVLFAANLRFGVALPWAVPVAAVYVWLFWRYLGGAGSPASTAALRRRSLRANQLPPGIWRWALLAGGLGMVALVLALRVASRLVALPSQQLPDLAHVPPLTVAALLIMAAPVAGVVEESAFRGYMQRPLERRLGIVAAILITGTMFALAHLDFTLVLWPYYLAVAAIYGLVAYLTDSILPAIVLHTFGNWFSNFDLWWHGRAEWQAPAHTAGLMWQVGLNASFWTSLAFLFVIGVLTIWAYSNLARRARSRVPTECQ